MVPRGFDKGPLYMPTISVLGGCLCFSYSYRQTNFCIWQMKKFGVEDSWTQLFKFSYHDLLIDHDDFRLVPLFLSEDGDSLILQSSLESQTILYNRRDNRAKRTEIIASRTAANNRTSGYVYWDFAKDYVESLVPIF
ncbi:hypothetical protein MtrunA17_Chr1g0151121 [Medicago truncatula]|nr:hypothetical protein MtrunA17_Chr1g0151121 [Medicago truncatula]